MKIVKKELLAAQIVVAFLLASQVTAQKQTQTGTERNLGQVPHKSREVVRFPNQPS